MWTLAVGVLRTDVVSLGAELARVAFRLLVELRQHLAVLFQLNSLVALIFSVLKFPSSFLCVCVSQGVTSFPCIA